MRRYAEETTVPVTRSRGEIEKLLRDFGCDGLRWADHWHEGRSRLEFTWIRGDVHYLARFDIRTPTDDDLAKLAIDQRNGRTSDAKLRKLRDARGKQEHRLLGLWIRAALNAVQAGIVAPEAIFLPFLVARDGQTFADAAIPRLPSLLAGPAAKLLPVVKP